MGEGQPGATPEAAINSEAQHPQATPPPDSSVLAPEAQLAENRSEQVRQIVEVVLGRATNDTIIGLGRMSEGEAEKAVSEDRGIGALLIRKRLQEISEGEKGDDLARAIEMSEGVEVKKIASIVRRQGNNFVCVVEGVEQPVSFSRESIINAQLVAEADAILEKITDENEREVLRRHIDILRSGEGALPTAGTPAGERLDEAMKAVEEKLAAPAQAQETGERPQTVEDRFIAEQVDILEKPDSIINTLRQEVAKLSGKDKAEKQKQLNDHEVALWTLKLAREANGDLGVLLKAVALQKLYDLKVISITQLTGFKDAWSSIQGQLSTAQQEFIGYLKLNRVDLSHEQITELSQGRPENVLKDLIDKGTIKFDENLTHRLFGRPMDEGELAQLLKGAKLTPEQLNFFKKHGKEAKGGLLILLLLALMGAKNAFTDLTMPRSMAA